MTLKGFMRFAAIMAWIAFALLIGAVAFVLYVASLLDRGEYWSDDPQRIISLFNRENAFDCEWCDLAEGQSAYLLAPQDIRADSKLCLFGGRPDARDPDALVAHGMMVGYETRLRQQGRYVSVGSGQEGIVLLRRREWDSTVALFHTKAVYIVMPNPPVTRCYGPDAVALVSRQLPELKFEIVTRDTP